MYRSPKEIAEIQQFFSTYDWQWTSRDARKWWPKLCFHYTDLPNVPKILKEGYLYSRNYLESHNAKWRDVASHQVLEKTSEDTKNSVRFYFRPRTPTQYRIEGIKSKTSIAQSTFPQHCPIPIFLLFDIVDILSRVNSQFSEGNLASEWSNTFNNPADLYNLPWRLIYHTGSFDPRQREITRHRCAEIVIPQKIDLNGLKYIFCRSEAEKETLLHLLKENPKISDKYSGIISSSGKYELFEKRHTFVESVNLNRDNVVIQFSPDTQSPGPFELKVNLIFSAFSKQLIKSINLSEFDFSIKVNIPEKWKGSYTIKVLLDDYLVYSNSFLDTLDYLDNIII